MDKINKTTTVYLVRHAEARGNLERVFQGHVDLEITERGCKQLGCLAERFRTVAFDAVYSSPLKRARETAEAVNRFHGLPVGLEPGLIEIGVGEWEGVRLEEISRRWPKEWELWNNAPDRFAAPGGEPMSGVYERMAATVTGLVRQNQGRTLVLVSHGCAGRNLLCWAHRMALGRLDEQPFGENTAVSRIDFDAGLQPSVAFENDVSHLPDELRISMRAYQVKSKAEDRA